MVFGLCRPMQQLGISVAAGLLSLKTLKSSIDYFAFDLVPPDLLTVLVFICPCRSSTVLSLWNNEFNEHLAYLILQYCWG